MRTIDGDHLKRWIIDRGLKSQLHPANIIDQIDREPTIEPERKKGKWTEKQVMSTADSKAIEQWQSCKCSVCGRYDTRPYLYYFDEPQYCSWCGAEMRGDNESRTD